MACLEAHNDYRDIHGVEPLKLNRRICAIAQDHATYLAEIDRAGHSCPDDRQFEGELLGENIAQKSFGNDFTGNFFFQLLHFRTNVFTNLRCFIFKQENLIN